MATKRDTATGRPMRAYVDTSVFGGVHDDEFRVASERFFRAVRAGGLTLLTSEPLTIEIASAPTRVQATFEGLESFMEPSVTTDEAHRSRQCISRGQSRPASLVRKRAPRRIGVGVTSRRGGQLEFQTSRPAPPYPRFPCREHASRLSTDRDPIPVGGHRWRRVSTSTVSR